MAREQGAGAARRSSTGLDPNRSSTRRVSAPRRQSASRPPPPVRRDARDPSSTTPRNVRKLKPAAGPSLGMRMVTRLFTRLFTDVHRVYHRGAAVRSRLAGHVDSAAGSARKWAGALALIALMLSTVYFVRKHLTSAPAFAIDTIEVKGLTRLDRAELLQTAGLALGQNVFVKSPEDVRAALLGHPWVVGAEVKRTLPSRFSLTVREREPVAIMLIDVCGPPRGGGGGGGADDESTCDEPNAMYLVSAEGSLLKRVGHKDSSDLPVITGLTRARYTNDPELSRRMVMEALSLLAAYRQSGLWERSPVGEVHVEPNDGLSLYVGDLTYVRLGIPPYAQKLQRMKKVFDRLERERARAEYVYLDNEQHPDRVAVRLR